MESFLAGALSSHQLLLNPVGNQISKLSFGLDTTGFLTLFSFTNCKFGPLFSQPS